MAVTINASTSAGLVQTADTSGVLQLQTNSGTTALTIDTSQNVGIGTTSPAAIASGHTVVDISAASGKSANIYLHGNGTSGTSAGLQIQSSTGDCGIYQANNLPMVFATNNTERMRISSVGNVDIGTTANTSKMSILQSSNQIALNIGNENVIDNGYYGALQITRPANPTGTAFHLAFIRNGNRIAGMGFLDNSDTFAIQNDASNTGPGVSLTASSTSWGTTSDERKKDIIGNVENAIEKLADWRTVYYKYKSDEEDAPQRIGLIAQDVQKTLPEAISIETDDIQTLQLRYTETIPVLVKAIQEQQTLIVSQSELITNLTARVTALEAK
jgi:hypothetical protein